MAAGGLGGAAGGAFAGALAGGMVGGPAGALAGAQIGFLNSLLAGAAYSGLNLAMTGSPGSIEGAMFTGAVTGGLSGFPAGVAAGQSQFKYIPVNEEVELNLGRVADVVVEPTLMDFKTENFEFNRKGNISGWVEVREFAVEVRNTRNTPVKVEIHRNFASVYWDLEKIGQFGHFEKVDKDTVKFTLALEPRSKQQFSYILTTYHVTRAR